MKLVSFQIKTPLGAHLRLGVLDGLGVIDLQQAYAHRLMSTGMSPGAVHRISRAVVPTNMVSFIEGGDLSLDAVRDALSWIAAEPDRKSAEGIVYRREQITMLAPIPRPPLIRDFMAFEEHLRNIYPKLGREVPEEWYRLPVYYKGNPASVGGDGDVVYFPDYADELDFEFELAAVIGRGGCDIAAETAANHIYGYMIYNDFSARAIQMREMSVGLGPAKGKDFVGGHVFGPYLATADEIPDPYQLNMLARVNGDTWCQSNSSSMHWKFEDMIAHASRSEEIWPGEIFGSGTVGWGSGAERGELLQSGDSVALTVDRLGTLTNKVQKRPCPDPGRKAQ